MIELAVVPGRTKGRSARLEHDVRKSLDWRTLQAGLDEARERRVPVLCLAEDPHTNAAQRLALFLDNDASLREQVATTCVPVLADPERAPELVDMILLAASRIEPDFAPPLLAVLTEEGLPLVTGCHITFEGEPGRPTLTGLIKSAADRYATDFAECLAAARQLVGEAPGVPGDAQNLYLPAWRLGRESDTEQIGQLLRAGIFDQLGGSFHRAARDPGWGVPHFEKSAAQNAQMAHVLARAGLIDEAKSCARFALGCLEQDSAGLASDTPYYTWEASEVLSALPAHELQMVGMHYRINSAGGSARHVLNQILTPEEAAERASGQTEQEALASLTSGKARLLVARHERPAPAALPPGALAGTLHGIAGLLGASRYLPDLPQASLLERLATVTGERHDSTWGLEAKDGSFRLHDQVAAVAAMRAAAATGAERFGREADRLLSVIQARYRRGEQWLARAGGSVLRGGRIDSGLPGVLDALDEAASVTAQPTGVAAASTA